MLTIDKVEVVGLQAASRGIRNLCGSVGTSDSGFCKGGKDGVGCWNCASRPCSHSYDGSFRLGREDHALMRSMAMVDEETALFLQMIVVYCDMVAPGYWWDEFYEGVHKAAQSGLVSLRLFSCMPRQTLMLNYAVLAKLYKLGKMGPSGGDWALFCEWIETLPYSELITGG